MVGIGLINLPVLFFPGNQQTGFLKPVQLDPDGVGRFVEIRLQVSQIRSSVAVQEKPQQQLNPRLACDKGI